MEKKTYQFQKNEGISFHDTTLEQRRELHKLMEKRGYAVAMPTHRRDKHYKSGLPSVWNAHFAFEFERMEWRAISTNSSHEKFFVFHPYNWWYEKLAYVIDNSESATDTMLDEQLEAFLANTIRIDE